MSLYENVCLSFTNYYFNILWKKCQPYIVGMVKSFTKMSHKKLLDASSSKFYIYKQTSMYVYTDTNIGIRYTWARSVHPCILICTYILSAFPL